jgi:hypothetical protein
MKIPDFKNTEKKDLNGLQKAATFEIKQAVSLDEFVEETNAFESSYWIDEFIESGDDKAYRGFVKNIERIVRSSVELKSLFKFLKTELDLNSCILLKGLNTENVTIELHHYPFTLFDIVDIVLRKRTMLKEPLNPISVAEEVTKIHFQKMVGLVPLSKTSHQLAHSGKVVILPQHIFGNVKAFMETYNIGLTSQHIQAVSILFSDKVKASASELNNFTLSRRLLAWSDTEIDLSENTDLEED